MNDANLISISTLMVGLLAVGGSTYAAIATARFQRNATGRQNSWEEAQATRTQAWESQEADRRHGLQLLREAYDQQIQAATKVEQFLWRAANLDLSPSQLGDEFKLQVNALIRDHAVCHASVQLLGSSTVVAQADIVGRDITRSAWEPTKIQVGALSESRRILLQLMRVDLGLSPAPFDDAQAIYGRPAPAPPSLPSS